MAGDDEKRTRPEENGDGEEPAPAPPGGDDELLAECDVEFVRAGGPGGQHRNRRETGVRLHHRPSGVTVMATERRSQARNRSLALERLRQRLAERARRPKKRRPTRKSAATKVRERRARDREAEKKRTRREPPPES